MNKNSIKYCKNCLMPNTKPHLSFDKKGFCNACNNSFLVEKISIKQNKYRESLLKKKINQAKKLNGLYDIIIPVSGGKDSLYQVYIAKKYTKKILAVCVDFGLRTKIGEDNLKLINEKLDVDLIKFSINQETIRKLALHSLKHYGDPDLFNHASIYTVPSLLAKKLNIPIVLYGEDSRFQYGFKNNFKQIEEITNQKFDKVFFDKFVNHSNIDLKKILTKLKIPTSEHCLFLFSKELQNVLFLGNYLNWDENKNYILAKKIGFKHPLKAEGTYRNFINVDENWNRVHHYLKLLKFGYGRCTDHICEDIRLKKINREAAIKVVRKYEFVPLGSKYINDLSKILKIKNKDTIKYIEKFRNKKIWIKKNSKWTLKNSEIFPSNIL